MVINKIEEEPSLISHFQLKAVVTVDKMPSVHAGMVLLISFSLIGFISMTFSMKHVARAKKGYM